MTISEIRDIALTTEGCAVCKAQPSSPCTCTPGLHLARVACAARDGHVSYPDFALAIPDDGFFGSAVVVLAGAQ